MELISKQKIEEAAEFLCNKRFSLEGKIKYGDLYMQGIFAGAQFAQNEITPLFCEFAEWSHRHAIAFFDENNNIDFCTDTKDGKTTQQLFELWLEERDKKQ